VLELLQHAAKLFATSAFGHADLFHILNHTTCSASPAWHAGFWQGGSHPLFFAPLLERRLVSRVSAAISSGSGSVLKVEARLALHPLLQCREMLVASAGHM